MDIFETLFPWPWIQWPALIVLLVIFYFRLKSPTNEDEQQSTASHYRKPFLQDARRPRQQLEVDPKKRAQRLKQS